MKKAQTKAPLDEKISRQGESIHKLSCAPTRESMENFEAGARKAQAAFGEALKKIRESMPPK